MQLLLAQRLRLCRQAGLLLQLLRLRLQQRLGAKRWRRPDCHGRHGYTACSCFKGAVCLAPARQAGRQQHQEAHHTNNAGAGGQGAYSSAAKAAVLLWHVLDRGSSRAEQASSLVG